MNIFQKFFQNFPAKISSVLIAVLIWIYVGSGLAQIDTFPGKIPIDFKNSPQGLIAVSDVESVSVKIVAASALWKNLNADSFSAIIDLSGFTEGTYELPVKLNSNVSDVQIVEVSPAKVLVRLEKITEKEVPVVLQVEGKAATGFVVGDWKLKPDRVKVSGASSELGKILEATAKITLAGEKDNLQRILKVVALDSAGNEIRNLSFSPSEVEAQVPLVQASSAKTVGIKVITSGQPADLINQISFIETKEINITGLSETKEFTTILKPAVGVTVLDNVPLVKAKIVVSPIASTRQFQVGFNWKNLNSSLKVASVDPEVVTLVLTGSTYDLSQVAVKDIAINVDLGSFSQAGVHSVDISRSNISLPNGISFSSVVPSAINVRLENL
ncbi:MAG: YbbR family protein [Berkelbacteria bacterium GW2011_GWB1_38_5]|uniref:YbbR family protein n=1 Tax=Berkelbacteria bacterium GW2011_GWB1_38_5 TaxID=1618336 RepID=A0A0G0N9H7_9BACT|nr:MAG: YbbR family protein [Berkelbacteria bacterium GW2011_GWB1_38_5]